MPGFSLLLDGSGSANGFLSIGCMLIDAVEVLDDTRDEADDVMLGVLLIGVLDPSVAEAVLLLIGVLDPSVAEAVLLLIRVLDPSVAEAVLSSSSSSSRFSANFPMLSKMTCILGTSGVSSSRSAITSSKPPMRHPRSLNMSKMLPPLRQESS